NRSVQEAGTLGPPEAPEPHRQDALHYDSSVDAGPAESPAASGAGARGGSATGLRPSTREMNRSTCSAWASETTTTKALQYVSVTRVMKYGMPSRDVSWSTR